MEREKIIKALESCTEQEYCVTCPCDNECLGMEFLIIKVLALIEELIGENERLNDTLKLYRKYNTAIKAERAYTINTFAMKLKKYYPALNDNTFSFSSMVAYHIDQIAKEMLEE